MLILEGPDLVGKTTLAQAFVKKLHRHMYRHFGRLPPNFDYFHDYETHSGHFFVQDRFHLSELVYGSVCRHSTPITPNLYTFIDGMLALKGAMTVVMYFEDEELLKERYDSRKEMFDLKQCLEVNEAYADLEECFPSYDIAYDYHLGLDRDTPYVTDHHVNLILDAYLDREKELFKIC